MAKKTYKISGMHCTSCSMVIEGDLEDIGVSARANYARQIVEIDELPAGVGESQVVAVIEKQGYKVIGVTT